MAGRMRSALVVVGLVIVAAGFRLYGQASPNVSFDNLVNAANRVADRLALEGISVEVVDPRTTSPMDETAILESVASTGRLVVVDESAARCGFGHDVVALAATQVFDELRAPIQLITPPHTPVPFSPALEREWVPGDDRIEAEHRRDADAKPRLHEVPVTARAGRSLGPHEILERLAHAAVASTARGHEDRELVRVDEEWIARRVRRRVQPGDARLGIRAEASASDDPLAPQDGRVAEVSAAYPQPAAQPEVFQHERGPLRRRRFGFGHAVRTRAYNLEKVRIRQPFKSSRAARRRRGESVMRRSKRP